MTRSTNPLIIIIIIITHVMPMRRRRSVTHVARVPPTAPGHGQQKQPVPITGADITALATPY